MPTVSLFAIHFAFDISTEPFDCSIEPVQDDWAIFLAFRVDCLCKTLPITTVFKPVQDSITALLEGNFQSLAPVSRQRQSTWRRRLWLSFHIAEEEFLSNRMATALPLPNCQFLLGARSKT